VNAAACKRKHYRREVLEISWWGKNMVEVLDLTFAEAFSFFDGERSIQRKIEFLNQLGLGYLKLGQSVDTLSGVEAQRIKLVKELSKLKRGHKLFILNEPTTGLHLADIQRLSDCLSSLVDAGHTVIVIEHNLEVVKTADWISDLGLEAGE
jgi:excinuclease ABC subunit A